MKETTMDKDPFGRTADGGGVHSMPEITSQNKPHAGKEHLILSLMPPSCLLLVPILDQPHTPGSPVDGVLRGQFPAVQSRTENSRGWN